MSRHPEDNNRLSTSAVKLVQSRSSTATDNEDVSNLPSDSVELRDLRPRRRPTITQAERTEAAASAALGGQGLYLAEDEQESEAELFNPDGSATKKQRINAFKALMGAGLITLVTIWAAATWLFGSLYNAENRVDNLTVLVANYDNGIFGQALLSSVQSVGSGPTTPTFIYTNMTVEEVKEKVWAGNVWGALWANAGQSEAFNASLADAATAETYNPADAYVYTGIQSRYFTVFQSYLYPVFLEATGIASGIVTTAAAGLTLDRQNLTPAQLKVLGYPAASTFYNPAPFTFTVRVLVNTVGIVIPMLLQFFFLMGLNGIFTGFGMHRSTSAATLLKIKYPVKIVWTLITGLSTASFAYIFAEGWDMPAKNFIALWALSWVYCLISFSTFAFLIAVVPIAFLSSFVFPIVMTSVAATVFPIDVQNAFYRISYMFPSHAYWNAAITVYSGGAYHKLHIYLPILAAWLVVGELAQCFAEYTTAKKSWKKQEEANH